MQFELEMLKQKWISLGRWEKSTWFSQWSFFHIKHLSNLIFHSSLNSIFVRLIFNYPTGLHLLSCWKQQERMRRRTLQGGNKTHNVCSIKEKPEIKWRQTEKEKKQKILQHTRRDWCCGGGIHWQTNVFAYFSKWLRCCSTWEKYFLSWLRKVFFVRL